MHSVFMAGSRSLSRLNLEVRERIDNVVRQNFAILLGDANGADKAFQRYLATIGYRNVVIYCMDACRNNVASWPVRNHTGAPGARHDRFYYGIKDVAMAKDATCGYMLWDGISKGTFSNVLELIRREKKVLLYISPRKQFFTVGSFESLRQALCAAGISDTQSLLKVRGTVADLKEPMQFGSGEAPSQEPRIR